MTINTLIAEDSSFQRKIIAEMISEHPDIKVVGAARNGKEAIKIIEKKNPDVLLLDIMMPEMDGLTLYRYLSQHYPIPTIVFSALDPNQASKALNDSIEALLLGAFDYVIKPGGVWRDEFPKFKEQLINKILLASKVEVKKEIIKKRINSVKLNSISRTISNQSMTQIRKEQQKEITKTNMKKDAKIIVIGASVGGPKTLKSILEDIPPGFQGSILIVQHLNPSFINQFSKSMNESCNIKVKVAVNGEIINSGQVYIAPGDKHMEISFKNNNGSPPRIKIFNGDPVNFCRPSIDVLFFSAAKVYKEKILAILLTGMGKDGVNGMGEIKKRGGITIAESEETCVVYGMPKFAVEKDFAQIISPNYKIIKHILSFIAKI
jgi:two-component system chemotaxis response regulator CheB